MALVIDQPGALDVPEVLRFLEAIEPFRVAMVPSFSYVAFRRNDRWEISRSRLSFNLPGHEITAMKVRTPSVLGGVEFVGEGEGEPRRIIGAMLAGQIEIAGETLHFAPNFDGGYARAFLPLHPQGVEQRQQRVAVLQLIGSDQAGFRGHIPFDWELRSAAEPYDGVAELEGALGLPILPDRTSIFEAIAFSVINIDGSSVVADSTARFVVRLAAGLDQEKAGIGYRIMSAGVVLARGELSSKSSLDWVVEPEVSIGTATLEVPSGAVIQAYARYDGVTYHHWWFNDPTNTQNARRAAYEVADPGLQVLDSYLSHPPGKEARDLEFGVSWLLWMLGFNPAHLGANQRMSDAADLLVATPAGHIAVVECTTRGLKADRKLPLLVERTAGIRNALSRSNNLHLRVLPLIVTTLTREEIKADLNDARELGVVVVAQEDLRELLGRTLLWPVADQLFVDAEQTIQNSADEPQLPLRN